MNLAKDGRQDTPFGGYSGFEVKALRVQRPFSFLPPVIKNNGDWNAFIDTAHQIYQNDLIVDPPTFLGKPVVVDNRMLDGKYMEGFWHAVQRDMRGDGERYPDFRRVERVSWIKPLIQNHTAEGVEYRRGPDNKREIRHHILVPSKNYVVILGEKKRATFLVTAYCTNRSFAERAIFRRSPLSESRMGAAAM